MGRSRIQLLTLLPGGQGEIEVRSRDVSAEKIVVGISEASLECRQHSSVLLNLAGSVSRGPDAARMNAVCGRAVIQQFDRSWNGGVTSLLR
jgi:hypothetical protein